MTFTEAAALVLRLVGKPLHYKEITDVAIERSMLSHVGKSPEVTMGARLAAQVKKADKENTLVRVKPGVFALVDWDEKTIEKGLADRTPALERLLKAEAEAEAEAKSKATEGDAEAEGEQDAQSAESTESADSQLTEPMAQHREIDDETAPPDEEEQHRAELSAGATELFESEDDDDQPIFGAPEAESTSEDGEGERDGKRRRRRRRGRGRRDEETSSDEGGDDLPTYTVSDAEPNELPANEPSNSSDFSVADSEPSASLAAALETALAKYDRSKGPVSAQNVADSLRRKMRGESAINGPATIAVAVAANLACERLGKPPTFRVTGNKLGLTAWSLDRRAQDRHRALNKAADQVSESTVRAVSDQLKHLSQRAIGELVMVLLDRMGLSNTAPVRRPGSHGSELHLAGILTLGGAVRIPTAVMIRRDGKDVGRERVTELRGAMHHYEQAAQGWIISTGQVLSGAREEAVSAGASPVILTGRNELAELCVAHGVGVRVHRIEVPVLDSELFENLQGR